MKQLQVRNPQRDLRVEARALKEFASALLDDLGIESYELGLHLVSAKRMAAVNQQFLQHDGPTDVITFDLRETNGAPLLGEVYICPAVAREQAAQFRTTWQAELVRYTVHGVLHLLGYDDLEPGKRRIMKREENRWVHALERRFDFARLARS